MSYLWVYNDPTGSYMSYISYGNVANNVKNNYREILQFSSFYDVHKYIKEQIDLFKTTFNNNESYIFNGKSMNKMYYDILSIEALFNKIMKTSLQNYYGEDYDTITQKIAEYNDSNNIITNGLDELNNSTHSIKYSQNIILDSTVFSTVLWTILAICLLYYIFIKL